MRLATGYRLYVVALGIALLTPSVSRADVLGMAYLDSPARYDAAIGFSHGAADAVFTVPSTGNGVCSGGLTLCFRSDDSTIDTLGHFLSSGGADIISGSQAGLSGSLNNTGFEFTGFVTVVTGQMFEAGHDDGMQFKIGDTLVIDSPQPTPLLYSPAVYTGPSGTFSFDLVYANCCGGPAILSMTLPAASLDAVQDVSEPASLGLLALGVLSLGVLRRRVAA